MQYLIEDFIYDTNACASRRHAFELYTKAVAKLGFDSAIYTFITDHYAANQKAGHGIQNNYPEDWMKHYWSRGYDKIDPVVKHAFTTSSAFSWKEIERSNRLSSAQKKILHESCDAGLNCGVGIPLYGPRGEIAGVGLACETPDVDVTSIVLHRLKLLTEQFHLVYCSLDSEVEDATAMPSLTRREIEILKWWAAGKTSDEIATIINRSKDSVKWHVRNIYIKLEANSRILAVSKAIRLGIIQLDSADIL